MRAIAKTITWRLIAATTTMATVYAMTGDLGTAGATALVAGTIKMVLYVYHDKAYDKWWNANETEEVVVAKAA